jgi:hypothetical protein
MGARFIAVTVANVGRRTVTVSKVFFTQKGGEPAFLLSDSMREGPKELAEGKAATFLANQEDFPFATVARVVVFDLADRRWSERVPPRIRRMTCSPRVPDHEKA